MVRKALKIPDGLRANWLLYASDEYCVLSFPLGESRAATIRALTPTQRKITGYLLLGYSAAKIARICGISVRTAEKHTEAIFRRLKVGSRRELASLMTRLGLDPSDFS
jgi:DNA-binding CsgD family transcriptional regulator